MNTLITFVIIASIVGAIVVSKSTTLSPGQKSDISLICYCGLILSVLALFHLI